LSENRRPKPHRGVGGKNLDKEKNPAREPFSGEGGLTDEVGEGGKREIQGENVVRVHKMAETLTEEGKQRPIQKGE